MTNQAQLAGTLSPGWAITKRLAQILLPLGFIFILCLPAYAYFVVGQAGQLLFGPEIEPANRFFVLFRLFGLYAIVFLWIQVMLGPLLTPLSALYGRSWPQFYERQALLVLLLVVGHGLIFSLASWLSNPSLPPTSWVAQYIGESLQRYVYLGGVAFILLSVMAGMAVFSGKGWAKRAWPWAQWLNYVVFGLVYVHSLAVGSDVRLQPLSALYWVMGVSFLLSLVYRGVYIGLVEVRSASWRKEVRDKRQVGEMK